MIAEDIIRFAIGGREFQLYLPDVDDHIQRVIRETNTFYELEMLADMMLHIAPGELMIDCGANIGNHTVFMAGAAEAMVIALEPYKHCFDILDRNIALNGLDAQALAINKACGAEGGTGMIVPGGPANLGQTRVATNARGLGADVDIIALDELQLPAPVKLIKIDVEGMEADVLRGAAGIIARDTPVIYAEAHDGTALAELAMVLKPFGYVPRVRFNATPTYRFEKR